VFIFDKIMEGIRNDNFIFLEPFIELISQKDINNYCPKYNDLEMYPDGSYGFYPYAFINYSKFKNKITVGNWEYGLNKQYSVCHFKNKSCKECISDYYSIDGLSDGSMAYEIRTSMIKKFFYSLLKQKNDKKIMKYITELKEIFNITYV
jgi:hypothetical protein